MMLALYSREGRSAPAAQAADVVVVHNDDRRRTGRRKVQVKWMYDSDGNLDKAHLVEAYAPLVKRIAFHLMAKLPASVLVDDIIQNGMIGLLDAISRYEDGMGAQFETYAVQRIRGAMLDGLREDDWLPRSLRRDMRKIEATIQSLEQAQGRAPSETEIAASLDIPLPEYQRMLQDARGHQLVYFEDFSDPEGEGFFDRHLGDDGGDPLGILEDAGMRDELVQAISDLPEREQLVMSFYYDQELNLREIGEVMGVSESRVCQLHSQAVARLRSHMTGGARASGARRGRPPKRQV